MKQADRDILTLLAQIRDAGVASGSEGGGGIPLSTGCRAGVSVPANETRYQTFTHISASSAVNGQEFTTSESQRQMIMPRAGTLKNFFIRTNSAQGSNASLTLTVRINEVDTDIVIVLPIDQAAGTFSDTTHTAAVVAGDLISFKGVNGDIEFASAALLQWAITVE